MNEVRQYFADAFRHMGGNRGVPAIEVRFYPYAGLRHTIRLRSGRVYVRVSDICKDCPPEVLRALAWILVSRLLGKRVPTIHDRVYRDYSLTPEVMRKSDLARRGRGRKMISSAHGEAYDLDRMFAKLNRRYFMVNFPNRRSPGHSVAREAFWATMITSTTVSRSASLSIPLKCRSGLLSTSSITRCCTSSILRV